jgi:MFS family permease
MWRVLRCAALAADIKRRAAWTLAVLTAINFLNYIDRYVMSVVLEGVKEDFVLRDTQGGLLAMVFIVVYMLFSPFGGFLGDRINRKAMIAAGVALWSLATVGSGLARNYEELLVMRGLVGIGEAGYAAVAPAIIADLYHVRRRGRMLAYFYLAIPVGSALGYVLGGLVSSNHEAVLGVLSLGHLDVPGWRVALCVAGVPGLIFAALAALMYEPRRGASEEKSSESQVAAGRSTGVLDGLKKLFRTPAWRINTVGMTLMTFALGGVAWWMPTFLQRAHSLDEGMAGTYAGGIAVIAGLLGTFIGGHLGDRAYARGPGGYFRVSGWGLILGAPFVIAMCMTGSTYAAFAFAFIAEFFLFLNTGPLNAALVGSVPAGLRATAVAVNVLFIHALGDAVSPTIMGGISEVVGGRVVEGGAEAESLGIRTAIAFTAVPLLAGGWWLIRGAKRVERAKGGLLQVDGDEGR